MVGQEGIEPPTPGSSNLRSTIELLSPTAYTYVLTGFYALLRQLTLDNLNPSVLYNPKGAIQTAIAPTPILVSRNVSTST